MDWDLKITDMAGATPEHSAVIVNFVAAVRHQLRNSTCYVYSDNVQYRFKDEEGNNKIVVPDASIIVVQNQDEVTPLQMPHVLLWKSCHLQQKIMIVPRKCNSIVSRKSRNTGLLTGARKLLKSMNWIMMEKFQNTSSGKPSQKKIKTSYTCSIFQISRSLLTSYLRKLIINGYITDRF